MSAICIFAGTTEGRELASLLAQNKIFCDVCVASEYGQSVLEDSKYTAVFQGRMNPEEMASFFEKQGTHIVVDATHPYALEVSKNIQESTTLPVLRLSRSSLNRDEDCVYFDSVQSCIEALEKKSGNVFLSTGSKDLKLYAKSPSLRSRLVVRVLPSIESLTLCQEAQLAGKQIIAMQPPFSKEMNVLQFKEYRISALVLKESGKIGGQDAKMEAAKELGITCFVIGKPKEEGLSFDEVVSSLSSFLNQKIVYKKQFFLIGLGMGNIEHVSKYALEKIEESDLIFGASRMIQGVSCKGQMYPYYLAKDILPVVETSHAKKIVILFSGDTGFFSGATKLRKTLESLYEVEVIPGISSVSYLSSKIGIPWQDLKIVSFHGKENWQELCKKYLEDKESFFFLTSGLQDVLRIKTMDWKDHDLYIGYQLSYPEEWVGKVDSKTEFHKEGLYCGMFVRKG
ncbi:MAG: precorrin-6A reductase [Firmicutes bacterium]|nr:precorrin-6A reductase [Bacillota bacterium]